MQRPVLRIRRTRARVSMPEIPTTPACGQIFFERAVRAKIAGHAAALAHDKAGQMRPAAFHVLGVDAVVADFRIGHRDDLTAVARIGQDLLISGHRGVEANFAVDFSLRAKRSAGKNGAVFQGEFGNFHDAPVAHVARGLPSRQGLRHCDGSGAIRLHGAACRARPAVLKFAPQIARYGCYGCGSPERTDAKFVQSGQPTKRVLAPASKSPLFFCAAARAIPARSVGFAAIIARAAQVGSRTRIVGDSARRVDALTSSAVTSSAARIVTIAGAHVERLGPAARHDLAFAASQKRHQAHAVAIGA